MECTKCGTINDSDGKFCKECGGRLDPSDTSPHPAVDLHKRIGELIYAAHKYKESGSIEDAMLACQGVLALNPDYHQARSLLGSLYELRGDAISAMSEYERVLAQKPDSPLEIERLEALRIQLTSAPRRASRLDALLLKCRPHTRLIASGAAFCLVLIVGMLIIRSIGRPAPVTTVSAASPIEAPAPQIQGAAQVTPPVQPDQRPADEAANQAKPAQAQAPQPQTSAKESAQAAPAGGAVPGGQSAAQVVRPKAQPAPKHMPKLTVRPVLVTSATEVRRNPGQSQSGVIVPVDDAPAPVRSVSSAPVITPDAGTISIRRSSSSTRAPRPAANITPEAQGYSLQRQGNYKEAIASYRAAVRKTGDAGRLYQQIGVCYRHLGQSGQAVDSFNQAIRAYRDQLAAGGDASDIGRSIKTCEAEISANQGQVR